MSDLGCELSGEAGFMVSVSVEEEQYCDSVAMTSQIRGSARSFRTLGRGGSAQARATLFSLVQRGIRKFP